MPPPPVLTGNIKIAWHCDIVKLKMVNGSAHYYILAGKISILRVFTQKCALQKVG
jgi:hypothetical protein